MVAKDTWRGLRSLFAAALLVMGAAEFTQAAEQWANEVIAYSSQYSATDWSAEQALGAPNTFAYEDEETAWAPLNRNGSDEYLTVGFAVPYYANGVVVRETWGNGFVYQIDALDANDQLRTVWTGTDTSAAGSPVNFLASFPQTNYLVYGVKIYVDTDHNATTYEEIDAVQLRGTTAPGGGVGCGAGAGIAWVALIPLALVRRRRLG